MYLVGLPTEPILTIGCYDNDECPLFNACENKKCINPCAERNPCAPTATCKVINHEPECTCPDGFIGSPLTDCRPRKFFLSFPSFDFQNNSFPLICTNTLLHDFISAPKPECILDPECPNHLACIQEKCQDPCYAHSCGQFAECKAKNHRAICVCFPGYVGDPYTFCEERKRTCYKSV